MHQNKRPRNDAQHDAINNLAVQPEFMSEEEVKQEILSILEQIKESLNEDQKLENIDRLNKLIIKLEQDTRDNTIDQIFFDKLKWLLENCEQIVQRKLLEILEFIVKSGVYPHYRVTPNQFYSDMESSSLIFWVENTILKEIRRQQQKKQNWKQSDLIMLLLNIYCQSTSGMEQRDEIRYKLADIIKYIRFQIYYFQNDPDNQQEMMRDGQQFNNNNLEKLLNIGGKAMSLIHQHHQETLEFFINQCELTEQIIEFIHINCPINIHCQQQLTLPNNSLVQEFQSNAFIALSSLLFDESEKIIRIINSSKILIHIFPIIINLAQSYTSHPEIHINNHNQLIPQNISFLHNGSSALMLLSKLLSQHPHLAQQSFYSHNLIQSLIYLSRFLRDANFIQNEDSYISMKVRMNAINSIIQNQKQILKNFKVISQSIIPAFCTAGGSKEQNNEILFTGLIALGRILDDYQYTTYFDYQEFIELTENEGGVEEIDEHFFHSSKMYNSWLLSNIALETRRSIVNEFKYQLV